MSMREHGDPTASKNMYACLEQPQTVPGLRMCIVTHYVSACPGIYPGAIRDLHIGSYIDRCCH